MELTGSEILVQCLREQGVDTVFGYPGKDWENTKTVSCRTLPHFRHQIKIRKCSYLCRAMISIKDAPVKKLVLLDPDFINSTNLNLSLHQTGSFTCVVKLTFVY